MKATIETRLRYQRWPLVIELSPGGVTVRQKGRSKESGQFVSWDQIALRAFPGAVQDGGAKETA